ncbi:hypothetical protein vseg_002000 [Gypsophila vaccaria]
MKIFMKMFDLESQQVHNLDPQMAMFAITHELRHGPLQSNLISNPPVTMTEVRTRADVYIREEEYKETCETKTQSHQPKK